jgi:class 3 adenylate cyclase
MNLAAKMQSVARGGQMIIGEKLYDKLDADTKTKFAKAVLDKNRINCTGGLCNRLFVFVYELSN